MSQKLITNIQENNLTQGFITLDEVKYIGNDDLIYDFADAGDTGTLIFRIEDLRYFKLMKKAPIAGIGLEQFDEEDAQEMQDAMADTES